MLACISLTTTTTSSTLNRDHMPIRSPFQLNGPWRESSLLHCFCNRDGAWTRRWQQRHARTKGKTAAACEPQGKGRLDLAVPLPSRLDRSWSRKVHPHTPTHAVWSLLLLLPSNHPRLFRRLSVSTGPSPLQKQWPNN